MATGGGLFSFAGVPSSGGIFCNAPGAGSDGGAAPKAPAAARKFPRKVAVVTIGIKDQLVIQVFTEDTDVKLSNTATEYTISGPVECVRMLKLDKTAEVPVPSITYTADGVRFAGAWDKLEISVEIQITDWETAFATPFGEAPQKKQRTM